jgi:murein tripeptide amidase MpaA
LLTITEKGTQEEIANRKGIVITARVHPGESNSSFVMKGIIDFLTSSDNIEAISLRKNFIFKLVPMINVDGVILGNYRCSLSGIDLNRVWRKPNLTLFPEVVAIKKLVETFNNENPVVLFADLHGHSMSREAFIYGNDYFHNPD